MQVKFQFKLNIEVEIKGREVDRPSQKMHILYQNLCYNTYNWPLCDFRNLYSLCRGKCIRHFVRGHACTRNKGQNSGTNTGCY